jgi:threonine synthase
MRYISTRGHAPSLDFTGVVQSGLASDGGLYVPDHWPHLDAATLDSWRNLPYADLAFQIMRPFVGDALPPEALQNILHKAYGSFTHQAVAPLVQLDRNLWLLELFHGPTLAFKDVALQFLGRLLDYQLTEKNQRLTVIGATSGDTGSAAIEACKASPLIDVFILYPAKGPSDIQRRQMTCVDAPNIHALAVDGTFDDCQRIVKQAFADQDLRQKLNLTAVNSINWARILAQIVYYISTALALGGPHRPMRFVVPTGNFGNIYAGYAAGQMGLPIDQLVVATNSNDILTRFFTTGRMTPGPVHQTLSPSMDIQRSSNAERLLFDLLGRDGAATAAAITAPDYHLPPALLPDLQKRFGAYAVSDLATRQTIRDFYAKTGELLDPHTAVACAAAQRLPPSTSPTICLATAHPAKFPDVVTAETGQIPALPPHLRDLMTKPERRQTFANSFDDIRAYVLAKR